MHLPKTVSRVFRLEVCSVKSKKQGAGGELWFGGGPEYPEAANWLWDAYWALEHLSIAGLVLSPNQTLGVLCTLSCRLRM